MASEDHFPKPSGATLATSPPIPIEEMNEIAPQITSESTNEQENGSSVSHSASGSSPSGSRVKPEEDCESFKQGGERPEQVKGWDVPASLAWIPKNWTWSNIKPAIRCAVAAWLSAVLFIIPAVEIYMGQVRLLTLIS
jgi:hypothetical protein